MSGLPRRAYVGIASNSATAIVRMAAGMQSLDRRFDGLMSSATFRSRAIDGRGAAYLNRVVRFDTALAWTALRDVLKEIERHCGRERGVAAGSQVALDLDLLIVRGHVAADDEYDLPLEQLRAASYVLAPLAELLPDWVHPQARISLAELWARSAPTAHPLQRLAPSPDRLSGCAGVAGR